MGDDDSVAPAVWPIRGIMDFPDVPEAPLPARQQATQGSTSPGYAGYSLPPLRKRLQGLSPAHLVR